MLHQMKVQTSVQFRIDAADTAWRLRISMSKLAQQILDAYLQDEIVLGEDDVIGRREHTSIRVDDEMWASAKVKAAANGDSIASVMRRGFIARRKEVLAAA